MAKANKVKITRGNFRSCGWRNSKEVMSWALLSQIKAMKGNRTVPNNTMPITAHLDDFGK